MGGFVHTTGFAPELLYPGIKAIWGQAYQQHPKLYEKFMSIESSNKRFEKEQGMTGFSLAGVKDEGDSVSFARLTQASKRNTFIQPMVLEPRSREKWPKTINTMSFLRSRDLWRRRCKERKKLLLMTS